MKNPSAHEQIKVQIAAFLFNNRADALRSEMYKALCLYVLNEINEPSTYEELVDSVTYAIDPEAEKSDGLATIVSETLNNLVANGYVIQAGNKFHISPVQAQALPDIATYEKVTRDVLEEVKKIALSIEPNLTPVQLERLSNFYSSICSQLAERQLGFLVKGLEINDPVIYSDTISEVVVQAESSYPVKDFIDSDLFIRRTIFAPDELLAHYLVLLIQVNLIFKLLTWDPTLDHLRTTVLANKNLYLDTSALFVLMLESNPLHNFFLNLIMSSVNELKVSVKIHQITIDEYEAVINRKTESFTHEQRTIRQVIKLYQKDGGELNDYFDDNLLIDYLRKNSDHVDLGTWQRFSNRISGESLKRILKELSISIDDQSAFVPNKEFGIISDNMLRASNQQAAKGKRNRKYDVTHDTRLFYLIHRIRQKPNGQTSLGYNTYLLTLDGSLTYFTKHQGIAWSETYFLFPIQWYELAFPFLRMRMSGDNAKEFLSLAFSSLLPALKPLIPLEMYRYIFDLGGVDLSLKSVQHIVDAMTEERLIERLDPTNKDIRERDEAGLRLQRMIAEKLVEENKLIEKVKAETKLLVLERDQLVTQVATQRESLQTIDANLRDSNQAIERYKTLRGQIETSQRELNNLTSLTEVQNVQKVALEQSLTRLAEEVEAQSNALGTQTTLREELENAQREISKLKAMQAEKEEQQLIQKERINFLVRIVFLPLTLLTIVVLGFPSVINFLSIQISPFIYVAVALFMYGWCFNRVKRIGEQSKAIVQTQWFKNYQKIYGVLIVIASILVGVLGNAIWDYAKTLFHLGP